MDAEAIKTSIEQLITNCISDYRLVQKARSVWKAPLIAYASARDPLFTKFRNVVSPSHHTPRQLLSGAETVIVYFLPFNERIVRSNAGPGPSSREWAVAYLETNTLIHAINEQLMQSLEQNGYAVTTMPATHNFDTKQLVSPWSHKHIAYAAGLGKFGLHHMLITAQGAAGRLGSLVTNAYITPSARVDKEACLYKHDGSCRACLSLCPVGALRETRFDRHACYVVCRENARRLNPEEKAEVCGKCVSVTPCALTDPVADQQKPQAPDA